MVGCQCRLLLYRAGADCNIRPTVPWWIQMVGVSVAFSSIELVPSVDLLYSGGCRWWVSVLHLPLAIWCRV